MSSADPAPRPRWRFGRGTGGYRADLDGLRGVAIAMVVVFHIWMGRVSGGVDVFLTLSGYFFLGSLLRGAARGRGLDPRPHLERLARRLYPVLVVAVTATVAATLLLKPSTQWSAILSQARASLLYYQNWELALTSQDYAAADATISPLQHLWSMSVQGQFYLAALAVVLSLGALFRFVIRRGSARIPLLVIMTAATAVSAWYAAVGRRENQAWNYFDTGARVWELLVGALLAALLGGLVLPVVLRLPLAVAGLSMVVGCGFLFDGAGEFPGPAAWFPVGGALLVVLAGATPADRPVRPWTDPVPWLLSRPLFTWLGDISYSLYLWHWPLLIMWLGVGDRHRVGPVDGIAVVVISLLLAALSERFVERPLRMRSRARGVRTPAARSRDARSPRPHLTRHQRRRLTTAAALVAICALASTGLSAYWALTSASRGAVTYIDAGQDPNHPGAKAYLEGAPTPADTPYLPTPVQVENDLPATTTDGCIADFTATEVVACVYGDPTAPPERTIALVGGSHSEFWISALDPVAKHFGVRIVTILKMGCPLSLDASLSDSGDKLYPSCAEWTPRALASIVAVHPAYVFTTATRPMAVIGPDSTPRQYVDLWKALGDQGIGVLAIRDTPWINHGAGAVRAGDCLSGKAGSPAACGMARAQSISAIHPAGLMAAGLPRVRLLDLTDAVCDPMVCPAVIGNVVVYHDSHHLSATFVRSTSTALARQLGTATGWW